MASQGDAAIHRMGQKLMGDAEHAGYTITWRNIALDIDIGSMFTQKRTIRTLKGSTGYMKPGESLAVIGPSGAGKTTLMDILASQKTLGRISGELLVNGAPPDAFFKKRAGYIFVNMAHIPTMTVRETIMFAAECRMPRGSTHAQIVARVDDVLESLRMTSAQHTPVGDELIRGVSSGEKKRTEVGIEMVAKPKVLFFDEPTSGLDDFGARFTMELVLSYVRSENVSVAVVIHQPAEAVFKLFDNVILIGGGGRICYFGATAQCEQYFSEYGFPCPPLMNPIEHYVDVISADTVGASEYYEKSALFAANDAEERRLAQAHYSAVSHSTHIVERNSWDQFKLLTARVLLRYQRNPSTSWGRFALFMCFALFFGGIFFQIPHAASYLGTINHGVGTFGFLSIFVAIASVPQFMEDRELYIQEFSAAFYTLPPYYLTYFVVEGVFTTVITTILLTTVYFMEGMPANKFGLTYAMMFVQMWVSTAVAQGWSAWCKTLIQAYTVLWAAGLIFFAFSGAVAPFGSFSQGLLWLTDVNYWRWTYQYVLYTITYDLEVDCDQAFPFGSIIPIYAGIYKGADAGGLVANGSDTVAVTAVSGYLNEIAAFNQILATNPPADVTAELNGAIASLQTQLSTSAKGGAAILTNATLMSALTTSNTNYGATNNVVAASTANATKALFPAEENICVYNPQSFLAAFNSIGKDCIACGNIAYVVNVSLLIFFVIFTLVTLLTLISTLVCGSPVATENDKPPVLLVLRLQF
ncbi:hypothetical protein SmJEL517_g00987 [Synchytrium microbalum]|uniref:ABC transporter domain-containing protein n=1 Tax=Synchytrium microbalum TaxID=1806994 RepID=A0A507CHY5_9FUNG|nr:uncharacterized protein SmJEL517_g00987 [Synchytrium microbalum]TPX37233.1 hypothetical protein SmJEL517_g00987 [Synchytrium microbalum]